MTTRSELPAERKPVDSPSIITQAPGSRGYAWAVACISAAVLGFEISLMRVLLVASWHHFAFLVISIVLVGFGASGTALCLARERVMPRAGRVLSCLILGTAASMPLCATAAQFVPVQARFVPTLVWEQIGYWLLFWAILTIPFLLGGSAIGLGLMSARQGVARVYAGNLAGSAAGSILAAGAMYVVAPQWLALVMGAVAMLGVVPLRMERQAVRWGSVTGCALLVLLCTVLVPPRIRPDPYKYSAHLQRLERQRSAERAAAAFSPRSLVEVYRGDVFHDMPFLDVGVAPPPMMVLALDGQPAGSVLNLSSPEEAEVTDHTLMAFAYDLLGPRSRPRVLLLGETGGRNVWLALRHRATAVDVVQPNDKLLALVRGRLGECGGGVFDRPGVQVMATEPRHYVDHASQRYDLIQLATLESSAAGSGGMGALGQDHLATVEGISACLERLTDDGVLFACRGIQTPPRDNVKLLATFAEALRRSGVAAPQQHVVIVRDYLAVCTLAKASPWTPPQIERVREICTRRQLTPVWYAGIRPGELNHPDILPGPPDSPGDWYYHAAKRLFSPEAASFLDEWPFAVRPATDDRPFFMDFCKLRSIRELQAGFGDMWMTRSELAFVFLLAAMVAVGLIGALLTLLPLLFLRAAARFTRRGVTVGYFAALGLAYLLLEMAFLSHLTHLIGDPVAAAAVTIAAFLLASGLGSLTAQRVTPARQGVLRAVFVGLLVIGVLEMAFIGRIAVAGGALPDVARSLLAVSIVSPLAYLMGFPMPAALARLDRASPGMIPWAWGVNGFASVLAAPLATAIGMTWGFTLAGTGALLLYLAAALLFFRLPDKMVTQQ